MNTDSIVNIVDDDEAIRDSLRLFLKSHGIKIAAFNSAEDFLEKADIEKPGCLILDIRMPGMNGLELQQYLNEQRSNLALIIISGHGDIAMAVQAIKNGAYDFIEKPIDANRLLELINLCLTDNITHKQKATEVNNSKNLLSNLTDRERQVMDKLVEGKLNKVIAADFDISVRTVEAHRAKVMEKLGVKSLSGIVRIALTADQDA